MSGIIQKVETTKTNHITGEVVETEKEQIIRYPRTEDFVMSFTKDLGYMKNLSKGEIMVVFGFLQIVNKSNEIVLNKSVKNRIANEFGLKVSSMDQLISNLKRKKIISSVYDENTQRNLRGIYLLNSFLFGKGNWMNIKKQRMYIEWDFKNKSKKTIIEMDYLTDEETANLAATQQEKFEKRYEENRKIEAKIEQNKEKSLFSENI